MRRTLDVHAWPVRLGRALDNTWVLDDPHVAAHHATLLPASDGRLLVQVGDTANGVLLGRHRLPRGARQVLPEDGALLQLGATRLRLRLPQETLLPELPLALPRVAGRLLWLLLLAWFLAQVLHRAVALDPGADLVQWLPWLLGLPTGLALWCGMWALGSKLFGHGFELASHGAIALTGLLVYELVDLVLPFTAAAFGWPLLWQVHRQWLLPLLAMAVVRAHLQQLLPQRRRLVDGVLGTVLVAGLVVNAVVNQRQRGDIFDAPYMHTLPPPALQWQRPVPVPQATEALKALRQAQDARAAEAAERDTEGEGP